MKKLALLAVVGFTLFASGCVVVPNHRVHLSLPHLSIGVSGHHGSVHVSGGHYNGHYRRHGRHHSSHNSSHGSSHGSSHSRSHSGSYRK